VAKYLIGQLLSHNHVICHMMGGVNLWCKKRIV